MANVNLGELNYEIGCREVLRACGRGYFSSKISHFKPQEVHMKPYKFILSATFKRTKLSSLSKYSVT